MAGLRRPRSEVILIESPPPVKDGNINCMARLHLNHTQMRPLSLTEQTGSRFFGVDGKRICNNDV
jgi:hypothetical protein